MMTIPTMRRTRSLEIGASFDISFSAAKMAISGSNRNNATNAIMIPMGATNLFLLFGSESILVIT